MTDVVQLADFRRQWEVSRDRYLEAVDRVGKSGWLILGKEVEQFERDLSVFWTLKHAVGVANGLDALELAFRGLGARPGDVYLTTPLSAFATTLAILKVGGVPVFADVDASGVLDLEAAGKVIAALPKKPRFFVPVHLFGHSMNLNALEAFTREHNLVLVEDCAQSIGAKSDGRLAGTVGAAAATSFYPTKNLGAFGDGGALLTNDSTLADRVRCLRDYGQTDKYVHDLAGINSRLDELQAALMRSVQLPLLAEQTERRRTLAATFLKNIKNPRLSLPQAPKGSASVWHLFPVLVTGDREQFRAHLKNKHVASGLHYPHLIPHQKGLLDAGLPAPTGSWPVAQRFASQEVSLPMHPFLTDDDASRVIDACNSWSA
jgi:dTDP-3-amino-3,4,6-trideoxy-alpha-D-glucose transaminase